MTLLQSPSISAASSNDVLQRVAYRQHLVGRNGKRFDSLGSQSTLNNLYVLQSCIFEYRPVATLEIGLAHGASAAVIAACHREQGQPPVGQHVAIDPFQRSVWDDSGRLTLEQQHLGGYVNVVEQFSDAALPQLIDSGWMCDLVYIDGSHLFEDVFVDFHFVNLLLRTNGIVLFDDSCNRHVRKALRFIERNRRDAYTKLDLLPHRKSGSRTFLYWLGQQIGRVQLTAFVKRGQSRRPWNSEFSDF